MQRFGQKVKTLRLQRKMSLRSLAKELGLSMHSYLDRIESSASYPSPELIIKIADYFSLSIDDLMRDERQIKES